MKIKGISRFLEEHFSAGVRQKGEKIKDKVEPREQPNSYTVTPRAGVRYRVQVTGAGDSPMVSCSCPNGLATGGSARCYHSVAVLLYLQEVQGEEQHESEISYE